MFYVHALMLGTAQRMGEDNMRSVSMATAGVLIAVWSTGVWGNDAKRDCLEGINQDLRIQSGSAVIDSNANDAMAYYMRAVAYQSKGDLDRAISDYTKAIELNPYHAAAYDGRARAYASKGNYTNAVADVTKAGELVTASQAKKVGPTKASELAPTSTPPTKEMTPESGLKTGRAPKEVKTVARPGVPGKEDGPAKGMAPSAKEAKTPDTGTSVAKKVPPQGGWPAWAPQRQSEN
jgi:tetrahydromethanopterin S-methyltransferase subunit B